MRATVFAATVCLMLAAPALAGDAVESPISWIESFDDGVQAAKESGKYLVVDFWTPT